MNEMILGYVIKTSHGEYLAIDQNSGGCAYWTSRIENAKIFKDKEEPILRLETSRDFNKDSIMTDGTKFPQRNSIVSDGTKFPPRMVQSAAGICAKTLKGNVIISIVPLILGNDVFNKRFTGEIETPKGYTY
ncbi:MAG: hypothetical protein ACTSXY_09005 [Promethearchaeota archaeon]